MSQRESCGGFDGRKEGCTWFDGGEIEFVERGVL